MASMRTSAGKVRRVLKPVGGTHLVRRLKNKIRMPIPNLRFVNRGKDRFDCPVCGYSGPFRDLESFAGFRKHAMCPKCSALERHRLQYLVVMDVLKGLNVREMKMLHFAPEKALKSIFSPRFQQYETADLFMKGVNHKVDIQKLPFKDGTYDFIFASHVLQHVQDDKRAIQEIRRVLRPNGIAVLPVAVVRTRTIEYPEANLLDSNYVRSPGLDYFERYKQCFAKVSIYASDRFPEKYQLFIYENRNVWPTKECPLREPMPGEKHADFVPVCYVCS
jgi:SAM-dependent methyltransferase